MNTNPWIEQAVEVLRLVAGSPETPLQWFLFGGTVFGVSFLMLKIMGIAVGNAKSTWTLNLLVLVAAAALLLAAMAAGRLYVHPQLATRVAPPWPDVLCAGIGLFALAVPMMCLIQRVRYLTALVTLLVTGTAAALVYLLVASARPGDTLENVRRRTERINEEIAP